MYVRGKKYVTSFEELCDKDLQLTPPPDSPRLIWVQSVFLRALMPPQADTGLICPGCGSFSASLGRARVQRGRLSSFLVASSFEWFYLFYEFGIFFCLHQVHCVHSSP